MSVVIVNWNAGELLPRCVQSLVETAMDLVSEIVVVDNASTDDSVAKLRAAFPEVMVLVNEHNRGFSAANNQGLRHTHGRYVLLLNPDTEVRPGALASLVGFLDTHPQVGACGPKLLNPDGTPQKCVGKLPSLGHEFTEKYFNNWLARWNVGGYLTRSYARAKPVGYVSGACLLLRRRAVEEVGPLDENFFMYFEDADLCCRLWQAGWQCYLVPQAEVVHYRGHSAEQNRALVGLEYRRSQMHYYRKHRPVVEVTVLRVGLAGRWAWAVLWSRCRPGVFPPAYVKGLRELWGESARG